MKELYTSFDFDTNKCYGSFLRKHAQQTEVEIVYFIIFVNIFF